jgi:hypothetical protein
MACCGNRKNKPLPGLPDLNAAAALLVAQQNGMKSAEVSLIERRIQSCRSCVYFSKELCTRCGCYVVAKVGKEYEKCPVLRW